MGTRAQFCSSFFHGMPIWELGFYDEICLQGKKHQECVPKLITVIARVLSPERELIKRYTNCRGYPKSDDTMLGQAAEKHETKRPIHTEEIIILDPDLLIPNSKIILYMQLQPCHHSGDCDGYYDPRSCTELVINWYRQKLLPRNISLRIECASLYKAMWYPPSPEEQESNEKTDKFNFVESSINAREGILMLSEAGIELSMLTENGWSFLLRSIKPPRKNRRNDFLNISSELWDRRMKLNKAMQEFLSKLLEA